MGILDDVMKVAGAGTAAAPATDSSQSPLLSAALSLLSNQSGGISGLVQQFASQGLGHVVNSWISTGQNLPISPEQLRSVLGSEQVGDIAAKAGVSSDAAQSGLAQLLPQLVDRLTPNGEIPQGDLMAKATELLKGKLF